VVAGREVSAFSAPLQDAADARAIKLWSAPDVELALPWDYWKFKFADSHNRLRITKEQFYIIRSFEKIHLPRGIAVYCRASDETIGEMRIHYAGFVHPFFGFERTDKFRGTPLIFEVRGHDIDVSLRHGEKMARLEFYRMSEDAVREERNDPYAGQSLKLSKFFREWPERAQCDDDGTVTPI
jgi:dCTP deaminase